MPKGVYTRSKNRAPRTVKIRPILTPIGPSISYIELTQGQFAQISSDDVPRVSSSSWCAIWNQNEKCFLAARKIKTAEGKRTQHLHAFLLGTRGRKITADHVVPGNQLNCLPHNLRVANSSQQVANQRPLEGTKSGLKGVSLQVSSNGTKAWVSAITSYGKRYYLGRYKTPEEAHAIYCDAAKKHHGEFARIA